MKSVAVVLLRAVGFVALFAGGFLAVVYSFSGGFNQSFGYWAVFFVGLFAIWSGDLLKTH